MKYQRLQNTIWIIALITIAFILGVGVLDFHKEEPIPSVNVESKRGMKKEYNQRSKFSGLGFHKAPTLSDSNLVNIYNEMQRLRDSITNYTPPANQDLYNLMYQEICKDSIIVEYDTVRTYKTTTVDLDGNVSTKTSKTHSLMYRNVGFIVQRHWVEDYTHYWPKPTTYKRLVSTEVRKIETPWNSKRPTAKQFVNWKKEKGYE